MNYTGANLEHFVSTLRSCDIVTTLCFELLRRSYPKPLTTQELIEKLKDASLFSKNLADLNITRQALIRNLGRHTLTPVGNILLERSEDLNYLWGFNQAQHDYILKSHQNLIFKFPHYY